MCRAAVEEDGWQLENVPEEMKTPELCRMALETEAGFGNDFHRGLVQHIPFAEVCMEVLKECRENNPCLLYTSRCRLLDAVRSDNNPQGFIIEGFEITENKDLQTLKR